MFTLPTHPLAQQLRSELRCDHSYCEVLPCGPPTILRGISSSIPQNGVVPALKRALDSQPDIQFASVFGLTTKLSNAPGRRKSQRTASAPPRSQEILLG